MKKFGLAAALSLTCLAIVLPLIGLFNHSNVIPDRPVHSADGGPPPLPVPPWASLFHSAA